MVLAGFRLCSAIAKPSQPNHVLRLDDNEVDSPVDNRVSTFRRDRTSSTGCLSSVVACVRPRESNRQRVVLMQNRHDQAADPHHGLECGR